MHLNKKSKVAYCGLTCLPLCGGHGDGTVVVVVAPGLFANEVLDGAAVAQHPLQIGAAQGHAALAQGAHVPGKTNSVISNEQFCLKGVTTYKFLAALMEGSAWSSWLSWFR